MINKICNSAKMVNFKGYSPTRKFELTKFDDIPCVYCGERTFALSKFDTALDTAGSKNKMFKVAEKYINYLSKEEAKKAEFKLLPREKKEFKRVLRNLFVPHSSTIEHIKPESHGGTYDLANLAAACQRCNGQRKSIPLPEWIRLHPDIPQNAQKHVDYLKIILPELIRNRKISPEYANYLELLAETLKKESEGLLDIKV